MSPLRWQRRVVSWNLVNVKANRAQPNSRLKRSRDVHVARRGTRLILLSCTLNRALCFRRGCDTPNSIVYDCEW